ncbi:MAG: hypothetical protein CVU48_10750 [Candidatus Cloacimonetes bacterium HGW-Cloacimonetes-1]|jgi:hypothetical protein|nr:MAG: hypothetical protein CVU48_10750 [Candidatus Cloacimonetes bacterium HGW-Cloacimonetes-1]
MERVFIVFVAVFGMLIFGCADVQLRVPLDIQGFETVAVFRTEETISKAVYDSRSGTTYARVQDWQTINLYRNGKRINTIGGIGSEKDRFQRLADIALDTNGNLLALDSVGKKLKVFSSEGKWLQEIDLKAMLQPELVAMAADQTLFIYDALAGEIVCYSALDYSEQYRFGKFQITKPQSLSCSRDYVISYKSAKGLSAIYSILGQFIRTSPGQVYIDVYGNHLVYEGGLLRSGSNSELLVLPGKALISLERDNICAVLDNEIRIIRINYLRAER